MPSFRVTLSIGAIDAGVPPDSIVSRAAAAASAFATVEATDVAIVAGAPSVIVRFTEDDADVALQLGEHVANTVETFARVSAYRVTQRVGSRWIPVV